MKSRIDIVRFAMPKGWLQDTSHSRATPAYLGRLFRDEVAALNID
jgi:hypothetical protein